MKRLSITLVLCATALLINSTQAMDLRNVKRYGVKPVAPQIIKNALLPAAKTKLSNASEVLAVQAENSPLAPAPKSFLQSSKETTAKALSSTWKTIKADLGLGQAYKELDNNTETFNLREDIITAGRLLIYTTLTTTTLALLAAKSMPNIQFFTQKPHEQPSRWPELSAICSAVILSPIMEELFFTYYPSNFSRAFLPAELNIPVTAITSILFGAAHYENNPVLWAFRTLLAGSGHYIRIRNYQARDRIFSAAPILTHAFWNASLLSVAYIANNYRK